MRAAECSGFIDSYRSAFGKRQIARISFEIVNFPSRFVASAMPADGQPALSQPTSDALLSQSQPAAGGQPDTCCLCKKLVGAKSSAIVRCASCTTYCHVSCIVNKFAVPYGTALKNSAQWLADFLNAGNFQFVCNACVESKSAGSGNSANDIAAIHQHQSLQKCSHDVHSLTVAPQA